MEEVSICQADTRGWNSKPSRLTFANMISIRQTTPVDDM